MYFAPVHGLCGELGMEDREQPEYSPRKRNAMASSPDTDSDQTGPIDATHSVAAQSQALNPAPSRRPQQPLKQENRAREQHPSQRISSPINHHPQSPVRQVQPASPGYQKPQSRQNSPWYLPWWSLVILVGVVGFVAFGLLAILATLTSPESPGDQSAQIFVITTQPTLSQNFLSDGNPPSQSLNAESTAIPQLAATATIALPTPIPSPSLPPGNLTIGAIVTVVGVGNSGLNIRSDPGMAGTLRFLAYDDDTFVLVDGPQNADGLVWWRIEDPNDPSRYGWAARNYLSTDAQ